MTAARHLTSDEAGVYTVGKCPGQKRLSPMPFEVRLETRLRNCSKLQFFTVTGFASNSAYTSLAPTSQLQFENGLVGGSHCQSAPVATVGRTAAA